MLSMTFEFFDHFVEEKKTVKHSSKLSWAFSQALSYTVNALEQLDVTCSSKTSHMRSIQSISSFSKIQKLYLINAKTSDLNPRVMCTAKSE